jgi:hypothetical protein
MTRSYIRRRKKLQTSTNAHNNPKKRRGEQANADQNLSQESAIRKRSKAVPPQETVAAIVIVVATTATKHQLQPGDNAQSAKRPKTVQALSEAGSTRRSPTGHAQRRALSMIDTSTSRRLRSEIAVVGAPRPKTPRGIHTREDR